MFLGIIHRLVYFKLCFKKKQDFLKKSVLKETGRFFKKCFKKKQDGI
jgi:hypothetical protein